MTVRLRTTYLLTPRTVPSVTSVSRRMGAVTTCSASIVNMTFVGCVWETGELMGPNITSVPDTKKIQTLPMSQCMLRLGKL